MLAGQTALANAQAAIYALPAADFHDITLGNNGPSGKYNAQSGYDLVTGRGSPLANLVVPALVSANNASFTLSATSHARASATFGFSIDWQWFAEVAGLDAGTTGMPADAPNVPPLGWATIDARATTPAATTSAGPASSSSSDYLPRDHFAVAKSATLAQPAAADDAAESMFVDLTKARAARARAATNNEAGTDIDRTTE
jgi:hypothetical protein